MQFELQSQTKRRRLSKSIHTSQWLLVGSLLGFMASLLLIAKVHSYRAESLLFAVTPSEPLIVTIEGCVAKPGPYFVPSGTPLSEPLRRAKPKPWANLQKIPTTQIVETPLHLFVEELTEITIYVEGAVVEPGPITLPAQSRIADLKTKVKLTPDADKTFFRRRKRLKNGEKIEVPKKTVELNGTL